VLPKAAVLTDIVAADSTTCLQSFETRQPSELARLSLSSGKSLPYDAGHYMMCVEVPKSRYLLITMSASGVGPNKPMKMEVGLCVPEECLVADAPDLLKSPMVLKIIPELSQLTLHSVSATSPTSMQPDAVGFVVMALVGAICCTIIWATFAQLRAKRHRSRWGDHGTPSQVLDAGTGALVGTQSASSQPMTPDSSGVPLEQTSTRPRRPGMLAQMFSLVGETGTVTKLLECPPYKPTDCLNGIRVLSIFWIILGHTFLMPTSIAGYSNQMDVVATSLNTHAAENNPFMMMILSAQSGVDTFLFLSGFLLSMLTLKELRSRRGKMNILAAIVLRYLRLTPCLALAMLVYYKVWPLLGRGPFAPRFQDSIISKCDPYWWSQLTYTMNFIPFDSDRVCMGWTWYLGVDMIFFIMGVFILPAYYRSRLLGWLSVITVAGMSFGITVWLLVSHNLSVYVFDEHYTDYSYWAYSKPYTRVPAYLVGVAAAWFMDELEQKGITRNNRPTGLAAQIGATVAAVVAFSVLLFLTFIPATDFGYYRKNSWGPVTSVLYLCFGRPLWASCWAVITLLCYYGYLPIVDGILSARCWTPLARLTYGAYLLHPLVIKLAAGRALQYYTFSAEDMLYRYLGNIICAFGGAALLWALVERPALTLTSSALKKGGNNRSGAPANGQTSSGDPEKGGAQQQQQQQQQTATTATTQGVSR